MSIEKTIPPARITLGEVVVNALIAFAMAIEKVALIIKAMIKAHAFKNKDILVKTTQVDHLVRDKFLVKGIILGDGQMVELKDVPVILSEVMDSFNFGENRLPYGRSIPNLIKHYLNANHPIVFGKGLYAHRNQLFIDQYEKDTHCEMYLDPSGKFMSTKRTRFALYREAEAHLALGEQLIEVYFTAANREPIDVLVGYLVFKREAPSFEFTVLQKIANHYGCHIVLAPNNEVPETSQHLERVANTLNLPGEHINGRFLDYEILPNNKIGVISNYNSRIIGMFIERNNKPFMVINEHNGKLL